MVYILANYGEKHLGFLLSSIYSIRKIAHEADVFVFWQDVNSKIAQLIQLTFPEVVFIETSFNINGNDTVRISSKTFFWHYAAEFLTNKGYTNACFMDSDTLLLKDVSHFFKDPFDIGFSLKEGVWPLNTGVLLVKLNSDTCQFFLSWLQLTIEVLDDPCSYQQASSIEFPYGGADQMSFYKLLGFDRAKSVYKRDNIILKGFDSALFNETQSRELQDCNHIIHYKGGWQPVLLEGKVFSKYRKLSDSLPQLNLFLTNYLELHKFFTKIHNSVEIPNLGIVIPTWYDQKNGRVKSLRYLQNQVLSIWDVYYKLVIQRIKKLKLAQMRNEYFKFFI